MSPPWGTHGLLFIIVMANFPLICQTLLVQSSLSRVKIIFPISLSVVFNKQQKERYGEITY